MTQQQKKTAGLAIASLILGILGVTCLGPLGAIPAVICGHLAKSDIKRSPDAVQGDGLALAGLILGYLCLAFFVLLMPLLAAIAVPNFIKAREESQKNGCLANMKQLQGAYEQALLAGVTSPTVNDIVGNGKYILVMPVCPKCNAPYTQFNPPACPGNVPGHVLP